MIYRQRVTVLDDLLLRVVFPWLVALRATPLLKLAQIWTVPVVERETERLRVDPAPPVWSKIGG